MAYENIIVQRKNRIEKIILNRPQVLNALNMKILQELKEELREVYISGETDILILTGAGRAFCAGLDVKEAIDAEYYGYSEEKQHDDTISLIVEVIDMIGNLPQPVIAAVNGYAVGGGLEITLVCDLVIASETAVFKDTHARIGICPGAGLSQKLPRAIGSIRAKELIFTSDSINALEAERIGLINHVVKPEYLDQAVDDLAYKILRNNSRMVRMIKSLIRRGSNLALGDAMRLEQEEFLQSRRQARPLDLNINICHQENPIYLKKEKASINN